MDNLANDSVSNGLSGADIAIVRHGLHADLKRSFGFLLLLHHRLRFWNGVRHRLLAIDCFASVHRIDGHCPVPVFWRCDDDVV